MQWLQWLLDFDASSLVTCEGEDRTVSSRRHCSVSHFWWKRRESWAKERLTKPSLTCLFVSQRVTAGGRSCAFIVLCFWKEAALLYVTSQRRDINNNAFKPWQLIFKCRPAARLWQYTGDDDKRNIKKWKICILWIIWTFEDIVFFFFFCLLAFASSCNQVDN